MALAIVALLIFSAPAQQADSGLTPVRMVLPNNMVAAAGITAHDLGFFTEQGLAVTISISTNAKMSQDLLLARRADVMLGANGPFTTLGFQPHPLKSIAILGKSYEAALSGRRDAGVKAPADIIGKRLGYLPGTISEIFLHKLVQRYSLDLTKVTLVPLQPPAMGAALSGGHVDAITIWEPWGYNARKLLGDNAYLYRDKTLYGYAVHVAVHEDWLRDNRDTAVRVLRALNKAVAVLRDEPERTYALLSKHTSLPEEFLRSHWDLYQFEMRPPDFIKELTEQAQLLIDHNPEFKNKPIPDYSRYIDDSVYRAWQAAP